MCPFALIPTILAFHLATPVTVEWLDGPARLTLVQQRSTDCQVMLPAPRLPQCEGWPAVELQWSPNGSSLTRATFTATVSSQSPLVEVRVTRPGGGTFTWLAPDGRSVLTHAHTTVAMSGSFEVFGRDQAGCQVRVRGTR